MAPGIACHEVTSTPSMSNNKASTSSRSVMTEVCHAPRHMNVRARSLQPDAHSLPYLGEIDPRVESLLAHEEFRVGRDEPVLRWEQWPRGADQREHRARHRLLRRTERHPVHLTDVCRQRSEGESRDAPQYRAPVGLCGRIEEEI